MDISVERKATRLFGKTILIVPALLALLAACAPDGTPAADAPGQPFAELTWEQSLPQPFRVAEANGLALGGKLYSFSGFDSTKRCCTPTDRAFVFDPEQQTWTLLAPMPPMNGTRHGGMTHAGIATDGQDIFFAGGYTANASGRGQIFGTREVLRYDPERDTYSRLPDLPVERAAGQLEYLDGKLYYFGGTNLARTENTGNLYILDLKGGATDWQDGTPLPNPRNHLGGVVLGGKIYAIAGQHGHDARLTTQADVHAYDPNANTWQHVADLPLPLSHIADSSFALDGRLVVVGGEIDHLEAVTNVFTYDPQEEMWSELTSLPDTRRSAVVDSIGGAIIVAGGAGDERSADTYVGTFVR
jgi:N-acetylneuraminic acid mutarotase